MATRMPRCSRPVVLSLLILVASPVVAAVTVFGADTVPGVTTGQPAVHPGQKNLLVVAIAGIFVIIYWLDRFNVPERKKTGPTAERETFRLPTTNRSSTTASRYYSAAATYCLIGVALYLSLVFSPEAWRHLAEVMKLGGAGALPPFVNEASSPFVVALALTVLVSKVSGFKHGDVWLRSNLHYCAAIPDEVRRLSKQLRASDDPAIETHTFSPTEEARNGLRLSLERELAEDIRAGVDLDQWIVFEPSVRSRDLAYRWTKAEVLMRQVGEWEAEGGFRRLLAHQRDHIDGLHLRRNALLKRMRELMRVTRAITSSEGTHALAAYQEVVAEDVQQFLRSLYDLVSAAVLSRNRTKGQIAADLAQLGFHVEWDPLKLTIHELVLTAILGFLVMILGFLSATVPSGVMKIQHALSISVLVGFASAGAVLSAILPRDKGWAIAKRSAPNRPAWGYYVMSGGLAMLLQAPFCLVFRLTRTLGLHVAWQHFMTRDVVGWLWVSFVMSAGLAALIDRERPIGDAWLGRGVCVLEGLLLAAGSGFTGLLVALVLGPMHAPLAPVVMILTVLGFILGLTIPSIYRGAPRTRTEALKRGT